MFNATNNATSTASTISRNEYGAIERGTPACATGRELVRLAVATGKLDAEYCDVDSKHRGSALNYDVYDVRGKVALVQRRYTVCTKYGNSPTKDYLLVQKVGTGVKVVDLAAYKHRVVRLAKAAKELGEVVEVLQRAVKAA